MKKQSLQKLFAGLTAIFTLASLSSFALTAQAAPITTPVSSITTDRATPETPRPTYSFYDAVLISFEWAVPDNAIAGDTFSVTLPTAINVENITPFSLVSETGDVVASAVWSFDGATSLMTANFTLNDYVTTHDGVHGGAYFTVHFDNSVYQVDARDLDLIFTMNDGSTQTAPVTLSANPVSEDPGELFLNNVHGEWADNADQGRTNPTAAINWSISPVGVSTTTGESPAYPNGLEFNLTFGQEQKVSASGYTVTDRFGVPLSTGKYTLTPTGISMMNVHGETWTIYGFRFATVGALEANERPEIHFSTDLTDNTELNYTVAGKITVDAVDDGEDKNIGAQVTRNTAGGTGDGVDDLPPVFSFGGVVFIDTNRDGIQNNGEVGVEGVNLTADRPTVRTFPTFAEGLFQANDIHLTPDDVLHGTITVSVPAGYVNTTPLTKPMFVIVGEEVTSPTITFGIVPSDEVEPPVEPPVVDPPIVVPPVVDPPIEVPTPEVPELPGTPELAHTGDDLTQPIALAVAAFVAGLALLVTRRKPRGVHTA